MTLVGLAYGMVADDDQVIALAEKSKTGHVSPFFNALANGS